MADNGAGQMMHKRSSSGHARAVSGPAHASTSQQPFDPRPSYLDATALSAAEYAVYPQWLAVIRPARSGEPDRFEEQDALRFLREQCGIGVHDEIKILSLFERFPLGLLPEHFYALLRLAAWVQRGEAPSKALLFTQTPPPRVSFNSGDFAQPQPSSPQHHATGGAMVTSPRSAQRASVPAGSSPKNIRSVPPLSSGIYAAAAGLHSSYNTNKPAPPPPVPDDSHKPNNPFRITSIGSSHAAAVQQSPIVGFDPAPNPFKQSKPKLIKPTPIVADASTPVMIRSTSGGVIASAAVDPFRSGQSNSSRANSPVSARSVVNASPPAIPGELRPPPLPPRHISPLIQASLNARSQVRRAREALPPKTFTVLQSTQSRHPLDGPRLLTGQAAPPPPPAQPAKRRSITDTRISSSSMTGGMQGGTATTSSKATTEHVPDRRVGPLPAPIAPKASYGTNNRKTSVPAWLQEQEELQRSSALDHHNEPAAPPREGAGHSRSTSRSKRRTKRTTSEAARIQFLDNDSDSSSDDADGTLSEQARSAASIDRNNPFFQHGRDVERSMNLKESLSKLAVENAVAKAEHESRMGQANSDGSTTKGDGVDRRGLGRSKTLRAGVPPAVPPRKRSEAFPATFNSGTYPGFGRPVRVEGPTIGGLRQMPTSRKAEVGIPAHVLAERERMEREKFERAATAPPQELDSSAMPPPPPPRRSNSNSQVSVSDGGTPQSPNDDDDDTLVPFSVGLGDVDGRRDGGEEFSASVKQEFEALTEGRSWLGRLASRVTGRNGTGEAQISLMEDIANQQQQNGDDEPEVDEHYLAEKRKEQLKERQWQRGHSIDVIREEDVNSPPGQQPVQGRRVSSGPVPHPSLSQRRSTDTSRRSPSTGAGMASVVRRSSMLARGSYGAEDVVADGDSEEGADDLTPRHEKGAILSPVGDRLNGKKAPDVDALGDQDRRQAGWQQLS